MCICVYVYMRVYTGSTGLCDCIWWCFAQATSRVCQNCQDSDGVTTRWESSSGQRSRSQPLWRARGQQHVSQPWWLALFFHPTHPSHYLLNSTDARTSPVPPDLCLKITAGSSACVSTKSSFCLRHISVASWDSSALLWVGLGSYNPL